MTDDERCPVCETFSMDDNSNQHQNFDIQVMKSWYKQ